MKNNNLKIGIIGAGNIGTKRATAIMEIGQDVIAGIFDINAEKAKVLADATKTKVFSGWQEMLKDVSIDAVIVATTTDVNAKIVKAALLAKKHVLAEKPLGKNTKEASELNFVAKRSKRVLKVGFNHRHHPAIFKAHELAKQGEIGKIMYIRSVYGHGGRPGYDLDWRMQKKFARGGELLDQGVHIIDLANWFVGGFNKAYGAVRNFYWSKSNLEDSAFCQLYTAKNQLVDFQVSITQWKNKFSFEIFGDKGYLTINGLGKSYGVETLVLGQGVGQGKVPEEQTWVFDGPDISWTQEWLEFTSAIAKRRAPLASGSDNVTVNKILDALYDSSKLLKAVSIKK